MKKIFIALVMVLVLISAALLANGLPIIERLKPMIGLPVTYNITVHCYSYKGGPLSPCMVKAAEFDPVSNTFATSSWTLTKYSKTGTVVFQLNKGANCIIAGKKVALSHFSEDGRYLGGDTWGGEGFYAPGPDSITPYVARIVNLNRDLIVNLIVRQ